MIKTGDQLIGFRLEKRAMVAELDGEGLLFRHEQSGARLLKIINNDDNKVFAITFKTPPPDDSGLPHILEHSVLNGSENFPVRSPFDVLSQGSLKTFLNAMTGSDMTIYPVASRNDKDFFNLMHVYLDAVFKPLLYKDTRILKQEGWHYDIDSPDAQLLYTGVVYNEMKGAFSVPQRTIDLIVARALFPDNCYSNSSGGYPPTIPLLDQERFESYHSLFYHPSNSYIYLYGNGELEKELKFIDEQYLQSYQRIEVPSDIPLQAPFKEVKEIVDVYSLPQGASTEGQSYIAWAGVIGQNTDQEMSICLDILAEALVNHQSGPLRLALQQAGIGQDVSASVDKIQQLVFQINVDNANETDFQRFKTVLKETMDQVCRDGLDRTMVEGIINRMEFNLREGQGVFTGVSGAIMAAPGWLFAQDPFSTLSFNRELALIREKVSAHHLEKLIEQLFIKNTHAVCVQLNPKEGLESEVMEECAAHLAKVKAEMSPEEIDNLIRETRELRAYQQRNDDPEKLALIPLLEISDISPEDEKIEACRLDIGSVPLFRIEEFTRGIVYFSLYLDAGGLEQELIPYLQLFHQLIGLLGTTNYAYGDLEDQVNLHTGGISTSIIPLPINRDDQSLRSFFVLKGKVMPERCVKLLELMGEQLMNTSWDKDPDRLKDLIYRLKAQTEQGLAHNPFNIAAIRLTSYFSDRGAYRDLISGHSYYLFLCDLVEQFDRQLPSIVHQLKRVQKSLVNRRTLSLSLTCQNEQADVIMAELNGFVDLFPDFSFKALEYSFNKQIKNEGFKDAGKVQYVIKGYDYRSLGYSYNGHMEVLAQFLSTVYLQNSVRVMGGAYGGFAILSDSGPLMFASYRDPNLEKTIAVYKECAAFLETLDLSERDLRRLIIGTISKRDYPRDPVQKAALYVERTFMGITEELRQKDRLDILSTRLEDLRSFSEMVGKVMNQDVLCVVGNEKRIEEQKALFKSTITLRR